MDVSCSRLHVALHSFRSASGKACYAVGLVFNLVIGPVLDMSGYAFAPASVVAPFTGFNVIINALLLGHA